MRLKRRLKKNWRGRGRGFFSTTGGVRLLRFPAWGSGPRPAGSRLAVTASGKLTGSVSGGCIEGAVADAAARTMLFDLDQSIQSLSVGRARDDADIDRLIHVYHNLIRRWAAP